MGRKCLCAKNLLLEDHRRGQIVCTGCGIVHSHSIISNAPEWRDFEGDSCDALKSRVGSPTVVGIPTYLQLQTFSSKHNSPEKMLFISYERNRRKIADRCIYFGLNNTVRDIAWQIYGIVRVCRSKIPDVECLYVAIIYHSIFICGKVIPFNTMVLELNVCKKTTASYLKLISRLLTGEIDNTEVRKLTFIVDYYLDPKTGNYSFPYLHGPDLKQRSILIAEWLIDQFHLEDIEKITKATLGIHDLYFKMFPDTQRSAETIGGGVFYQSIRICSLSETYTEITSHVKLNSIGKLVGVSDATINGIVRDLPNMDTIKNGNTTKN